ncbi:MAG: response regulator transcription factor, partial [Kiritimatiellae bacterium]|nr:response regulator transcription factor [Kiritimatiellia bacterium]
MHEEYILAIEDDSAIRTVLGVALRAAGFAEVRFALTGDEGLAMAMAHPPRLVLLDLMLPGMDGREVCRQLRQNDSTKTVPVIMLTALDDECDVVAGLKTGADDYITKPFSTAVLIARIRAVLRRSLGAAADEMVLDGLTLNPDSRLVVVDGRETSLTPTEYGILQLLMAHPGRVYTRGQIIDAVQGYGKSVIERTVDVQMVGLRRKLGDWAQHLEAVRSVGYRLNP